jgi:S-adenosylmethionine-diacylgycerolhomoserine-N-methlytransferase
VDVVTFSYALTMIPDWFAALENAWGMLRPGGHIGVVDYYVSRKYPAEGMARHRFGTRAFWPLWFGVDNVFPSPDHLHWLRNRYDTIRQVEDRARLPYLPLARAPYYLFIGRKPGRHGCGA